MVRLDTEFAIIGGGTAGLAADKHLRAAGKTSLILEATKFVGGRIRTENGIETGARLIHDARMKPVIEQYGLRAIPFDENAGAYLFQSDERRLEKDDDGHFSIAGLIEELRRKIQVLTRPDIVLPSQFFDEPLVNRLSRSGNMHLGKFFEDLRQFDPSLAKRISAKFGVIQHSLQAEYGAAPQDIGIQSLCEQSTFNNSNYLVEGGFSQLPMRMAEEADIRYRTPVHTLHWDTHPLLLRTPHGNLRARKAIVTAPLGILQKNKMRFVPDLPPEYQQAIDRLGNATICEIIYQSREAFWPQDMTVLRTDLPYAPIIWPNESKTPTLTCYVGGRPSRELQKMDEEEAVKIVLKQLEHIFGKDIRKLITGGKRIAWNEKRWKRTGYSFTRQGHEGARKTLSEPINDNVVLAGEAYIPDETASTVYGAYLSGIHAADTLLRSS